MTCRAHVALPHADLIRSSAATNASFAAIALAISEAVKGETRNLRPGPPRAGIRGCHSGADAIFGISEKRKKIQKLDFSNFSVFRSLDYLDQTIGTKDKYLIANCEEKGYYLSSHT